MERNKNHHLNNLSFQQSNLDIFDFKIKLLAIFFALLPPKMEKWLHSITENLRPPPRNSWQNCSSVKTQFICNSAETHIWVTCLSLSWIWLMKTITLFSEVREYLTLVCLVTRFCSWVWVTLCSQLSSVWAVSLRVISSNPHYGLRKASKLWLNSW